MSTETHSQASKGLDAAPKDFITLYVKAEAASEGYEEEDLGFGVTTDSKLDFSKQHVIKAMTTGVREKKRRESLSSVFQEISMNLLLFMLAGYDTTSNALSYITYLLATHPEEQAKTRDEVDRIFNECVRSFPFTARIFLQFDFGVNASLILDTNSRLH